MNIQPVSSSQRTQSFNGIYFTKSNTVLFNNHADYITEEPFKMAKRGARYIEDNVIKPATKIAFRKNEFIRRLSKHNDVFIWHKEIEPNEFNPRYQAFVKISWLSKKSGYAESRMAKGQSKISQKEATKKMFDNLEKSEFSVMY